MWLVLRAAPRSGRAPWSEGEQRSLDWGEAEGGRQGRRRESGLAGAVGLRFEAKELDRSLRGGHGSWGDFRSCSLSPQSYEGAVDFNTFHTTDVERGAQRAP